MGQWSFWPAKRRGISAPSGREAMQRLEAPKIRSRIEQLACPRRFNPFVEHLPAVMPDHSRRGLDDYVGWQMPMLMIRCPRTGQPVFTGVETDRTSLQRLPDSGGHLRCPICGKDHEWGRRDARFSEEFEWESRRVARH